MVIKNKRFHYLSYILNVFLFFISYFNVINPWHISIPFLTFIIIINNIIWIVTKKQWQYENKNILIIIFASILFLLFQFNLHISTNILLIKHIYSNMSSFYIGEISGIILRSFVILTSFLILIFGKKQAN